MFDDAIGVGFWFVVAAGRTLRETTHAKVIVWTRAVGASDAHLHLMVSMRPVLGMGLKKE